MFDGSKKLRCLSNLHCCNSGLLSLSMFFLNFEQFLPKVFDGLWPIVIGGSKGLSFRFMSNEHTYTPSDLLSLFMFDGPKGFAFLQNYHCNPLGCPLSSSMFFLDLEPLVKSVW